MTNSKELFNDLISRVLLQEDKSEIQSIIYLLLEKKLGLTKTEILTGKEIGPITPGYFEPLIKQLNAHVPIQYILGEAEFYGRTFNVNPFVLIPRPETELLVREIKSSLLKLKFTSPRILDIGTGSGCIAITLALDIPQSSVQATDVSNEAITTAILNAKALGASIKYHEHNILTHDIPFDQFDLIVSNPPYISDEEKSAMSKNVLAYEPHLALFAPEKDPLAFYKAIAFKSKTALSPGGSVWVEINEHFGNEVFDIFNQLEYHNIQIINDLDNKHRIVTARL